MRTVEWKRLVRPLLGDDAEHWGFRGNLCYRKPADWLLLGVLAEGSGFSAGMYVWRVVMPLFVPEDHVVLSYSHRIAGGRNFSAEQRGELESALAAVLAGPWDEDVELARLANLDAPENRLVNEASGYAALLRGDARLAERRLRIAAAMSPDNRAWVVQARARSAESLASLDDGAALLRKMRHWRQSTLAALGVDG